MTITTEDAIESNNENKVASDLKLYSPQKRWQVFLLTCGTASIYMIPWLYRHVSNLRKISMRGYVPWLWLLVPIFAITVPFALHRLFEGFQDVADERKIRWHASGLLGGILAFVVLGTARAIDRTGGPVSVSILMIILIALILAYLTGKLNQFYAHLDAESFRTTPYKLTIPSWVILIVIAPVVALGLGITAQEDWYKYFQPTLPTDRAYLVDSHPISITTKSRWSIVKIGTRSDGTALLELIGDTGTTFVLLFDHTKNEGIDNIMEFRRDSIYALYPDAQCSENRTLDENTMQRSAVLSCTATGSLDKTAWKIAVLEGEDKNYEFVGEAAASANVFPKTKAALDDLFRGFRLIE